MKLTSEQFKLLRLVSEAIIDAVASAGHSGAPAGLVYAALASQGCTMQQFNGIMGGLVLGGMLRKEGDLYFATGKEFGPVPVRCHSPRPAASEAAPLERANMHPVIPRGWEAIDGGKEVQS